MAGLRKRTGAEHAAALDGATAHRPRKPAIGQYSNQTMDPGPSLNTEASTPQHWIQILVGVVSIATVLLPLTGIVTFQVSHIAIRSLPAELVGGMPIAELAINGFSPTLYALSLGAVFYITGRLLQQFTATSAEIEASREAASAAGVSRESAATLERDLKAVEQRREQLDSQRRALTVGLAADTLSAAQARTASAEIEASSAEINGELEAILVRAQQMTAAAQNMVKQIETAESVLDQWLIVRVIRRISPFLTRIPNRVVGTMPALISILIFGALLLVFPLVTVLTIAAVNFLTQWYAARQRLAREPLTIARSIPVVATLLLVTSVGLGLTTGPTRLVDAVFDPVTGLSPATFGYLGSTGEARYLLDCSGLDHVLAVPHDRVTLTIRPRPFDTSPTLLTWLQNTSQPLLPFIGPTCGSQTRP